MRILEYTGLGITGVAAPYRQAVDAIGCEDFRAAEVKKLANLSHGKFYRARLDGAGHLLFVLATPERFLLPSPRSAAHAKTR